MRLIMSLLAACTLIAVGPTLAGKKNRASGYANRPITTEKS